MSRFRYVAQDLADKVFVYAQLGTPEYLVFDPVGTLLKGPIRAWRLSAPVASAYTLWLPDEQGHLFSAALALMIVVMQPLLGMLDRDGRAIESSVAMARRIEELEQRLRADEQRAPEHEEGP